MVPDTPGQFQQRDHHASRRTDRAHSEAQHGEAQHGEEQLQQAMEAADAGTWTLDVESGQFVASVRALERPGLLDATSAVRESEERFRALADNMSQLAWMSDASGNVSWYNHRWHEYSGISLEELLERGWQRLLHPQHLHRVVQRLHQSYATGDTWEDTFPLRGRDGLYRWFLSRARPIRNTDGAITRWFGTSTDVTEQLDLERALKEADRRKDEFLATLAHELRNPLAPIRNGLQAIRLAGGNQELIDQTHHMMERQVAQMTHLIDDLMDLSRISLGRIVLQRQRLDLAEAIRNAVDTSRWLMEQHAHQLVLHLPEQPLYVDGDLTRLSQIFGNLLNNAAKYTDHGGRIELRVTPEGQQVRVEVIDTGVGIEEMMLDRVFDMFTQVDRSLERAHGGLGIGLNIVAKLVHMHNGTIKVHSDGPGRGSKFTVVLPRAVHREAEDHTPAIPTENLRPKGKRILIVDDNHDGAISLATMLRLMGHDTRTAHDGLDALAMAEQFLPDLILMDLGMPRLNGFEACRRLREQPWGRTMTVIAQTGWSQEEDKRKALESGFDSHLTKPIDIASLHKLLRESVK